MATGDTKNLRSGHGSDGHAGSDDGNDSFRQFQSCAAATLGVKVEDVTPDKSFEQLQADSLDIVEFLMALEETFGIEIDETELNGIDTVEQAYELLTSKL